MTIKYALISLSDKTGALAFAKGLHDQNVRLISTGGTAKLLADAGLPVIEIADHTGHPEMLDGRVKTLHPKVHGGILARRDLPEHMKTLADHGITAIDLVCVNLYPFEATIAKPTVRLEDAIENIDIGGPAMLRSSAKNYASVAVLTDPNDYEAVLLEMKANGGALLPKTRFALAKKAFTHTARYDAAIANFLTSLDETDNPQTRSLFPEKLHCAFDRAEVLRYGENPHQSAAFYRDVSPPVGAIATYTQIQGKELSYNNIADADAALECVKAFEKPACVIVKHANPCGVAVAKDVKTAYEKAYLTDPTSAFGGILAVNGVFEADLVEAMSTRSHFVEVIIAPAYTQEAKNLLSKKPNIRVLEVPFSTACSSRALEMKRVGGGLLVQTPDDETLVLANLKTASQRAPTQAEYDDLLFAWTVAKFVKSNAIVFCKDGMTLGVGAGQMSRVDATRIASIKAQNAGLSLKGAVASSDAFFPFRDGLDVVAATGASAIIQPGGSMRDDEVIAAVNEHGMAMLLTGMRHFRH